MLLTGTFNRALDEKLRIAIPKHLRDDPALSARRRPLRDPRYGWFAYPVHGGCFSVARSAARPKSADAAGRAGLQPPLLRPGPVRVELDRQGRIRIPPELATLAKLQNEVVLVGVQDHLEIWALEHWQTYVADKQAHYDEIAETALGGP